MLTHADVCSRIRSSRDARFDEHARFDQHAPAAPAGRPAGRALHSPVQQQRYSGQAGGGGGGGGGTLDGLAGGGHALGGGGAGGGGPRDGGVEGGGAEAVSESNMNVLSNIKKLVHSLLLLNPVVSLLALLVQNCKYWRRRRFQEAYLSRGAWNNNIFYYYCFS